MAYAIIHTYASCGYNGVSTMAGHGGVLDTLERVEEFIEKMDKDPFAERISPVDSIWLVYPEERAMEEGKNFSSVELLLQRDCTECER